MLTPIGPITSTSRNRSGKNTQSSSTGFPEGSIRHTDVVQPSGSSTKNARTEEKVSKSYYISIYSLHCIDTTNLHHIEPPAQVPPARVPPAPASSEDEEYEPPDESSDDTSVGEEEPFPPASSNDIDMSEDDSLGGLSHKFSKSSIDTTTPYLQLFCPHKVYMWEDNDGVRRVTYEMVLPSGTLPENIDVRVRSDGRVLHIIYTYPEDLFAEDFLENVTGGRVEQSHSMSRGMSNSIRAMKVRFDHGPVKSAMKLRLPFVCEDEPKGVDGIFQGIELVSHIVHTIYYIYILIH